MTALLSVQPLLYHHPEQHQQDYPHVVVNGCVDEVTIVLVVAAAAAVVVIVAVVAVVPAVLELHEYLYQMFLPLVQ